MEFTLILFACPICTSIKYMGNKDVRVSELDVQVIWSQIYVLYKVGQKDLRSSPCTDNVQLCPALYSKVKI